MQKMFSVRRAVCELISAVTLILSILVPVSAEPQGSSSQPSVSARSAVLADGESGNIVWSKNADERLPMASTTKIMTAIVAIENCELSSDVEIPPEACGVEGSSIYLKPGEHLTLEELLFAMMLESANDAACAVAIAVAGSIPQFAELMNETAQSIGMSDSHFTNPHGLDNEEHYTTAADMAKLAVHALANEDFARIVSTYKKTIPLCGDEGTRVLLNHNKLLKYYDDAVGIKTGFTKRSGRCLVSAAKRNGMTMVAVTLSAPDDWNDHMAMLDYGFSVLRHETIAGVGDVSLAIPVAGGASQTIEIRNTEEIGVTLPAAAGEVKTVIEAPRFLFAPVSEGDAVGRARFFVDGKEVASVTLSAASSCKIQKKQSFFERVRELYK